MNPPFASAAATILYGISDDGTFVGDYEVLTPNSSDFHGLIGTGAITTPEPRFLAGVAVLFLFATGICYTRKRPKVD